MGMTYSVVFDQAEIDAAVTAHVKAKLGITGNVDIVITNGGRALANLSAKVDVVTGAVPVQVAVAVDTPEVNTLEGAGTALADDVPPFVPEVNQAEPASEVEAVMQQESVAEVLSFS